MEIVSPLHYGEYERFVQEHPAGTITQSVNWHAVKDNWNHEVVVSRNETGGIVGGMSVLIRKLPPFGTAMMYAPRGPVCDWHDEAVMADLIKGADMLAKKYNAHLFKMDPEVAADDQAFLSLAKKLGFQRFYGPDGFETIQARFNYRLFLQGRIEEELLMNLTQQTRRNVRLARDKHGVEVRIRGKEALGEFMNLMVVTGKRDGFSIRSRDYFEKMLDALGEHVRLYMAYYQGEAVSGAITTNYAGKTSYIYGASGNEHRNVMPNYLVQWEMIRWAAETGCALYDFQGVSGDLSEDGHMYGLYRFKRGFNGQLDEFAGEFDRVYMPARSRMIDLAIGVNDKLRAVKRKAGGQ